MQGQWLLSGKPRRSIATLDERRQLAGSRPANPSSFGAQATNRHSVLMHKSGPLLGPFLIKRQEKRVISSDSHQRIQTHYNYEAYLRSVGAHPEQAPRVNASLKAIEEYNKAVEKVRYGSLTAIGTDPIKTFSGGLKDYQEEVGLEHAFDAHGNEVVVSNQRYDDIERDRIDASTLGSIRAQLLLAPRL
jgi:hypothetical protein